MTEIQKITRELDPELKPWERQPWEDDYAWGLFQIYRDIAPYNRSARESYRIYLENTGRYNPQERWQVPRQVAEIRSGNQWVARAEAWDRYQDKVLRAEILHRKKESVIGVADLGRSLRLKAAEALTGLEAVIRDDAGNLRTELSPNAIAKLADVGTKLERLALGMQDNSRPLVAVQVNTTQQATDLSDEDLVKAAKEVIEGRSQVL